MLAAGRIRAGSSWHVRDARSAGFEREIVVAAGNAGLPGHLVIPERAGGIVVFAHGSGSSRRSPRNRFVAAALNEAGLGTLLVDLLTPDEELSRANVFNVPAARRAADQHHRLAAPESRRSQSPGWLLWREYRRGGGAVGWRQPTGANRSDRLPGRAA